MKTYLATYYNNLDGHFLGYMDGHRLVFVMSSPVVAESFAAAADVAWQLHNRDDRPSGQMAPSMSVGDVVRLQYLLLDDRWYAVESVGFSRIPNPMLNENTKPITDRTWEQIRDEERVTNA